jgi:hypothetical protein
MSRPLPPNDPAQILLQDPNVFSTPHPGVYDHHCYICNDREFAQLGMPLCRPCPECRRLQRGQGHIPADDNFCTVCGQNEDDYEEAWLWIQSRADDIRVLWPVEFVISDQWGAWGIGERGIDHGLESRLSGLPIWIISVRNQVLTLTDPYARGLIRRVAG